MDVSMRVSSPLAIIVVFGAIAQVVAPIVPFAGVGASPNESTVDLLITPAGYTFSIWSVIYLLSIVLAATVLLTRSTGTRAAHRLAVDLSIAFFGAAIWILFSAAEWRWVTSIVLTVMTVALLDAARIAAGHRDEDAPGWRTALTRVTVGIYAGWATAAVFQNWASDIADSGADPDEPWWQLVILIAAAVFASVVTWLFGGVLIGYPLTVIWALVGIIVTAAGVTPSVVIICAVTIVVVAAVAGVVMLRGRARPSVA
ncbi:MFS transporter [Gordonia sp. PKS22-38]|uniref:MFS transporter n=1 Tax=Gordonia prachuapensis TaxID=3115651 RepID=A0ABU7MXN4_9ACTN|nr:MFS transporter [Gordonia sp. PKS22-38]